KRSAEVAAIAGLSDFAGLNQLPLVAAQDAQMPRNWAAVASDVEPLVRMLEDTPRSRVIEVAAERVRNGTSYQELLAAVMLAGGASASSAPASPSSIRPTWRASPPAIAIAGCPSPGASTRSRRRRSGIGPRATGTCPPPPRTTCRARPRRDVVFARRWIAGTS